MTRMLESDEHTDEPTSGCVGIALLGAILLSFVGALTAFSELGTAMYAPEGSRSAHKHFAYNIFFGTLAFAWVPVSLVYRLSNRDGWCGLISWRSFGRVAIAEWQLSVYNAIMTG